MGGWLGVRARTCGRDDKVHGDEGEMGLLRGGFGGTERLGRQDRQVEALPCEMLSIEDGTLP